MDRKEVNMISAFRIDERLIHGQVIATWLKTLGVSHLLVASDEIANDALRQDTLKMVLPQNLKCLIKGTNDIINILKDPRCQKMKILLIVGSPQDAVKLVEEIPEISEVNLANYGSITKPNIKDKVSISKMVYLDEDDIKSVNKIIELEKTVFTQKTPSDLKKNINVIV